MGNLVTHHLLFTAQVVTPLVLDEHSGSALRGNLFQAVWERFCTNKTATSCTDCPLHTTCAVSALVAPLREEHVRGRDIPRPYIILPPLSEMEAMPVSPWNSKLILVSVRIGVLGSTAIVATTCRGLLGLSLSAVTSPV